MNALWQPIADAAARTPDAPALRAAGVELSYAALRARVAAYAAALLAQGVAPGDVVALGAERTPDTLAALLAIVAMGAAYLPLDPTHSDAWLASMLEDAQPRVGIGPAALRARLPQQIAWCEPDAAASAVPAREGELAYVLFTSGSTGRPKGVAMRSTALAHLLDWHRSHARLGRAARTLQFAPLGFDVSFQEIFSTLQAGGTLVLPSDAERRDPWALAALLDAEAIERLFLPYVALQSLADATQNGARAPHALRDVITAGEALRITPAIRALCAAQPGRVLHNHYGPTEAHVVTAHELAGDPAAWPELPPIGRALPHVTIHIQADPSVEAGGELWLGGDCLAAGYIGRPELTVERFVLRDGARWYRSGDAVRMADDGTLEYLGRLDDQIKVAGYRIEPGEIEAALCRHAEVAQAAVVAEDAPGGKRLVAHVVPRDANADEATLAAGLRAHCRATLAHYLEPQAYVLHAALPQTASGKVDRRALARHAGSALEWRAELPLIERVAGLWRQLLARDAIAPAANLFDLGASSLSVVHALAELRRHGHVLTVAQVYENPSVAALSALLDGALSDAKPDANADLRGARQRAALARFAGARR